MGFVCVGLARLKWVLLQLDEATFVTAWAEGQAMTVEQAIAYALEETPDE